MTNIDIHMQSQMNSGFYTEDELKIMGFSHLGKNVLISKLAQIHNASQIQIQDNVRIDDYVILSGKIQLGSYIHIGAFSSITGGKKGVYIGDFCNMSSYCKIFAVSDNFYEGYLAGPCIPLDFRKVNEKRVVLEKFNNLASHSLVLPCSHFAIGASLGPMSVNIGKNFEAWGYYYGNPARKITEINKKQVLSLKNKMTKWSIKE